MMADAGSRTLAVFGARSESLGEAVAATMLNAPGRHGALTIGISGDEDIQQDPADVLGVANILKENNVTDVLITVGMNVGADLNEMALGEALHDSFVVNVILPMKILQASLMVKSVGSVVFISSNSAHIARRGSLPYCASKAALSMAIRVAARENAGEVLIYGYEPGLLEGTPMTEETASRWSGPLHRIPGLGMREGLSRFEFADIIVSNLLVPTLALNGALIRLDGGEQ